MKENKSRRFLDYLDIVIGCAITALSIVLFLTPAKLAPGGISGISTIVYHVTGLNQGLVMLALSVPIYLLGVKIFGKLYGIKTLTGTILLSLFTILWNYIFGYDGILDYSKDMSYWMSALYGGFISGLGLGIVLRSGSNTGGTDIIAQIIARYSRLPIGSALMIVDGIIILLSAFIFGIENALFAIIVSLIVTLVIDKFIMTLGTGYAKTVYIVSDNLEELKEFILIDMDRSGTILDAEGLYTGKTRKVLMTVVPNKDISRLTRAVRSIDPKAFMIIQDTIHVLGEGYQTLNHLADSSDITQSST